MTDPSRYTTVAVFFHWLIAAAIIGMLIVGFYMGALDRTDPGKFALYQLHKSFGITILILSLPRLGWRLLHAPPPMPVWEKCAAKATHWAFYGFMIGMPLVGWLGVSASPMKMPTRIFQIFTLPALPFFENDPDRGATMHKLFEIHSVMAWALIALLLLHAAAAMKHHFIDKDEVLLNMAPRMLGSLLKKLRGQSGAALAVFCCLTSVPVHAADYIADPARSTLTFAAVQGGETFMGGFRKFLPMIRFDPNDLANSMIVVNIDMRSAYAGAPERDQALPGKDWFDTLRFPQAALVSQSIAQTGPGRYLAQAVLTLRGVSKTVEMPFTLREEDGVTHAHGEVAVMRNDFGVGQGEFANDGWIKYNVLVAADIVAVKQ